MSITKSTLEKSMNSHCNSIFIHKSESQNSLDQYQSIQGELSNINVGCAT